MDDITVKELKQRREQGEEVMLIDVRDPYEHEEFNIGGENLPVGRIHEWMPDLSSEKDTEIVLYCQTGNRSGMAKQFLSSSGFTSTRNLLGGIVAWKELVEE